MITLQEQIEAVNDAVADDGGNCIDHAILASLRRLQEIEQQEPVKAIDSRTDEVINWYPSLAHVTMDGSTLRYDPLYALPVSPEAPYIPYADEWKKNVMRLWTCARKHDSDIPDAQLDFMRDYLLKASEVSHD